MPAFRFNKLVRDKLPAIYSAHNQQITMKKLTGSDLFLALRDKLIEEVNELPCNKNERAECIEELADIEQLLIDFKSYLQISDEEIEQKRKDKLNKKGGFLGGVCIESITLEATDKWVKYYRSNTHKYPEITLSQPHDQETIVCGVYRHAKSGKDYQVVAVGMHTETNERMVVYKPLYKSEHEYFIRPYEMFTEQVVIDGVEQPRFVRAKD